MVQISHKPLNEDIESEMYKQLWENLAKIRDPQTASHFFSDLLTSTEKVMIAKRFTIAVLLIRGKTHVDIKDTLNVSFSTIGSVASWVKNAKPKTKEFYKKLSKEKDWEVILDKIDEILEKLPPPYYSDWSTKNKEKWKNTMHRATKRNLR